MPQNYIDFISLEELRESGNYEKLAARLTDDWRGAPAFECETIRLRLLAAEMSGRAGRLDEMEAAIAPYLSDVNKVPFGLAARVLLTLALYHYRRTEPNEALRLASRSRAIAEVCDDELTMAEAVQLEGQALWSLERWDEAALAFEEAISVYAAQSRPYRLGLAYLCLGGVLNRMGNVEEARTSLERSIKILLRCQDEYNLAVARVNIAQVLNRMGEPETALDYLLFAHDTFERMGHEQYEYLTLNSIAVTLVYLKEYDKAENQIARAMEKGAAARSTQIASTYEIKARIQIARREWAQAERSLLAASEIADHAGSLSQKAEARRTLGRLYIAQDREDEAAHVLWQALDLAQRLRASLLELEIKALLAQATYMGSPVEAYRMVSEVETALGDRPLPELRKDVLAARRRIDSLDQEHYFILSDREIPLLADAKIKLLKWLWSRALHKARGNAREAAAILDVTPTYIRKLTKVIPRDLLRPGRKKSRTKRPKISDQ
ncbi:MAG: tetratricopeptide repeat protein [Blastocatellia bacterium]|nr:tetratricopeptide repeat protein [Blastocatellia bacterium]